MPPRLKVVPLFLPSPHAATSTRRKRARVDPEAALSSLGSTLSRGLSSFPHHHSHRDSLFRPVAIWASRRPLTLELLCRPHGAPCFVTSTCQSCEER